MNVEEQIKQSDWWRDAEKTPNILIDDREKNIWEWEAFGGIGLLHVTGDSARTIEELKQLGL